MRIPYSKKIFSFLKIYLKMKRKNQILIGVGITASIILFGYLFFFLIGPIMLIGPPLSLFNIYNNTTEHHMIIIEIFDENNYSVLKEIYNLSSGENVKYDRGIGWYPKISWFLITWPDGIYTFFFTLDNKYVERYTTDISFTCSLSIELFYKDYWTNETFPIYIRESCV